MKPELTTVPKMDKIKNKTSSYLIFYPIHLNIFLFFLRFALCLIARVR